MPLLVNPIAAAQVQLAPVEAVFLLEEGVLSLSGRLLVRRGDVFEVEFDEPPAADVGTRVVLAIAGETPRRIQGRIEGATGSRVRVQGHRAKSPDQRRFPRLFGAIGLRWRRLAEGHAEPWREPDPLMSFSVVGFAFGGTDGETTEGDLVSLDFAIGGTGPRHAGIGRVVRIAPRQPDDVVGGETHEIAVDLLEASPEAREALGEYMLRIQRALTRTRE